jgi:hypothetical protein
MNKMSEKIVSAMNESEVQTMILDHYLGEAQTLTQGTEENLLCLTRNHMKRRLPKQSRTLRAS